MTGSGNGPAEFEFDETTNYQEFGQNLITRQLTSTNVNSFVAYDQTEPIDGIVIFGGVFGCPAHLN